VIVCHVRVLHGARLAHAQAVRGSQGPAVAAAFLRLMVSVAGKCHSLCTWCALPLVLAKAGPLRQSARTCS
jgi:hypothetical protein